ncbi:MULTISPECIES: hypothetical protein [Chryseobacterium]|nr:MULTISPECIES: hypothetical protein [Chryseobacterium]MCS4305304.1 hypothetical protein [Chryseobacterium sp. BIGb0232]ROS07515.1 hypothetical protein EDF65_4902 [Chryseobacterium nakagawai]
MKTESTNEHNSSGSGVMSNDLIKALIDNYRQNQMNAINEAMGIDDAHSIWFDLPKLKDFISLIEQEARAVNPECTQEDLGIRFYYAAYPKIEDWEIMDSHPVPQEYSERHTLVLIPTMKRENTEGESLHYDFNSLHNEGKSVALNARKSTKPSNLGENSGTLIPPSPSINESY